MSDNITLPRKHIDYAAHALEHFNKDAPDPLVSEIIHHLRTALAAEPTKPVRLHATTTGVLLGSAWLVWNTPKGANDEIMSQETADLLNRIFADAEALRREDSK